MVGAIVHERVVPLPRVVAVERRSNERQDSGVGDIGRVAEEVMQIDAADVRLDERNSDAERERENLRGRPVSDPGKRRQLLERGGHRAAVLG